MSKNFLIIEQEPSGHHFEMYLKAILSKFKQKDKIILLTSSRALNSNLLNNIKKKNFKIEIYEDINSFYFPIKFFQIILNQFSNYFFLQRKFKKLNRKYHFNHIIINTIDDYFLPFSIIGCPFNVKYSAIFNNPNFTKKKGDIKDLFSFFKIALFNRMLKQRHLFKIYFNNYLTYNFLKNKIFLKHKIEWFYEPIKFSFKKYSPNRKKIILVYGAIKKSKCIRELLDIFKFSKKNQLIKYKVNIIGQQYQDVKSLLNSSYCKKLIKSGKLYVKNKFVSNLEEKFFFKNSYIVWVAYDKKFLNSSGVLFTALKNFKPVIANSNGYISYLVKRYNLGETCNVNDRISILNNLKKLEEKKNYNSKVSSIFKFKKEYIKNSFYKKIVF